MRTPEEMLEQVGQLVRAISAAGYPRGQVRFPVTEDEAFELARHIHDRSSAHGDDGPLCGPPDHLMLHGIKCSWADVDSRVWRAWMS